MHAHDQQTEERAARLVGSLLTSKSLRPGAPEGLAPFRPLIGSWDLTVVDHDRDGSSTTRQGEWHFSWGLDGRALIDVWVTPSRATRGADGQGEWGMSVRFFDPDSDSILSTWLGPFNRVVFPFQANAASDTITLTRHKEDGATIRWQFSDITPDSFVWRHTEEVPGEDVFLRQQFDARRIDVPTQTK